MWIVPKSLQASLPFALDTVASSEDLSSLASTIELSLMWRSKPSPLPTWLRRWNREPWVQRLFGRTLKPFQHNFFEDEWISSLAATHVSPFRLRENEKAQTIQGTFGRTFGDTFKQSDLFDASLRTSRGTSVLDCRKLSKTWKQIVTKRRGEYSARLKSAHRIEENEYSSWPTPTQDSSTSRSKKYAQGGMPLQVAVQIWPTPRANDAKKSENCDPTNPRNGLPAAVMTWPTPRTTDTHQGRGVVEINGKLYRPSKALSEGRLVGGANLADAVQMWPTPAARDWKDARGMATQAGDRSRLDQLPRAVYAKNSDQKSGTLNPNWVEWLMGLPTGWTDLGSWATE